MKCLVPSNNAEVACACHFDHMSTTRSSSSNQNVVLSSLSLTTKPFVRTTRSGVAAGNSVLWEGDNLLVWHMLLKHRISVALLGRKVRLIPNIAQDLPLQILCGCIHIFQFPGPGTQRNLLDFGRRREQTSKMCGCSLHLELLSVCGLTTVDLEHLELPGPSSSKVLDSRAAPTAS